MPGIPKTGVCLLSQARNGLGVYGGPCSEIQVRSNWCLFPFRESLESWVFTPSVEIQCSVFPLVWAGGGVERRNDKVHGVL